MREQCLRLVAESVWYAVQRERDRITHAYPGQNKYLAPQDEAERRVGKRLIDLLSFDAGSDQ